MVDAKVIEAVNFFKTELERKGIRINNLVLFGSSSTGPLQPGSDIDIAVISDDFSRMDRGRILLHSLWVTAFSPASILHWPGMVRVLLGAVETDIPVYVWPKLGITLLWVGADGIDARLITREMVRPFVTSEGAQVLEPIWELIRPVVLEMFRQ